MERLRRAFAAHRGGSLLDRVRWLFVLLNVLVAASAPLEATYDSAPAWPANLLMAIAYVGLGGWAVWMHRIGGRGALVELAPFVLLMVGGIAGGDADAVLGRMVLAMFLHALYRPSRRRLVILGSGYTVMITTVGAVLGNEAESAAAYFIGIAILFVMLAILQAIATTLRQHEIARERDAVLTRTVASLLAERDGERLDQRVADGLWELLDDPEGLAAIWSDTGDTLVLRASVGRLPDGVERVDLRDMPADVREGYRRGEARSFDATDILRLGTPVNGSHTAAVSVPIVTDGRPRGVVALGSAKPLDDDLMSVLQRFAHEVALAQQLTEREQLLAGVIANSPDLVAVVDATGHLTFVSPAVQAWTGHRPEDLEGCPLEELLRHEQDDRPVELAQLSPTSPLLLRLASGPRGRDTGSRREVEVTANALPDGTRVLGIRDVSERRRLEAEITYRAYYDSVTGLPNRTCFLERLQALSEEGNSLERAAVVLLDLDDFKAINDTLGHAAGDQLLTQVGQRLQGAIRQGDLAARLGGDEFAVLLGAVDSDDHATAITERLLSVLRTPVTVDGRHVRVAASAGVAMVMASPGDAVLRNADLAMYAAKELGKDRVALFHPGMHEEVVAFQELRSELETAITQGQLVVHYQPIVELGSGTPVGVEALVRWEHPRLGMVPPDRFIPVAEETGLIVELGREVLTEACCEIATWPCPPDAAPPQLSVNLSPVQLRDPRLFADVVSALERSGLQPAQLTLEITETALIGETALVSQVLTELRQLGLRIAIDDFGTGYSSISHLNAMPVDSIKIDREFIDAIDSSEETSRLADAIVKLARTLDLNTVAEGVEHRSQQEALVGWGCTYGQGWLWSPARPAEAARALWLETRPEVDPRRSTSAP